MYKKRSSLGTTTVATAGGRVRVLTSFDNNTECVEEFDESSNDLLVRRWRTRTTLGGWGKWEFEIGEARGAAQTSNGGLLIASRSKNPIFVPQDSKNAFIWRIRNLPYPKPTYQLSVDEEKQEFILRTTNKKYFKRFDIPAMKRVDLKIDARFVSCEHSNSTLCVRYEKPPQILEIEAKQRSLRLAKLNAQSQQQGGDGSAGEVPECKQQ